MLDVIASLRTVPFFQNLPAEAVDDIARAGRVESKTSGALLCREGETSRSMYAVLEGTIRVYKTDADGNEFELNRLGPGSVLGELALLDGAPRSASVQCVSDGELYVLEQVDFLDALESHPHLLRGVVLALTAQLRDRVEDDFRREQTLWTVRTEAEIARHRSLAQMVAGVAHELNTPLASAANAGDIIAKRLKRPEVEIVMGADPVTRLIWEDIHEAAELMQRNLQRAHKLVESFKRLSVYQQTNTVERVQLTEALAETVQLFSFNARHAGLRISIDDRLGEGVNREWTGCVGYLTQVVLNLLSNVERYAYPRSAGGAVEISISEGRLGAQPAFVITVEDFGVGMDARSLARIFDAFYTTGRTKGGTGLGMAIVHNLVTDAMHGTIHVKSTLNQGTAVSVALPIATQPGAATLSTGRVP